VADVRDVYGRPRVEDEGVSQRVVLQRVVLQRVVLLRVVLLRVVLLRVVLFARLKGYSDTLAADCCYLPAI
jgi:hypothetical protein